MSDKIELIVVETQPSPQAAVIWLHGLGADGSDFVPIVSQLNLPHAIGIRFIFPHALERSVTLNKGFIMRAWYDILGLELDSKQDAKGVWTAQQNLNRLIAEQVIHGIPAEKIVLAGFSQGGALALHTGLRYPQKLAGIMALSTYLPLANTLAAERSLANQHTSIFLAHGTSDQILTVDFYKLSKRCLGQLGYIVENHLYLRMGHSVCKAEINDISLWLQLILG